MDNQLAVFIDFENIALWAEQELLDFELTSLMQYLQGRGPVVIKRAYGDWGRFSRYRDELMSNSIDLIQLYSIRAGKNRADIRMALDALETATQRPHIQTFVIVSGDSDFGALAGRLREYGRYTLGVGPRDATHRFLVKSCDEFIYLETVLGEVAGAADEDTHTTSDRQSARELLRKALQAYGQRGEIPVLAAKLKHTMLSLNSTFNEANLGYPQFKAWLEDNGDLVRLFVKDLQLYVAPIDFTAPSEVVSGASVAEYPTAVSDALPPDKSSLEMEYRQVLSRLKMASVDFNTRRDVLRDIYRLLSGGTGEQTTNELVDELQRRYELEGKSRSKTLLRQIWQMGFRQRVFDYGDQSASVHVPVRLAEGIDDEADFVRRAESGQVYAIIQAGLEIDRAELAAALLKDRGQTAYIQELLDDLERRNLIIRQGERYRLASQTVIPYRDEPFLQIVCSDIDRVRLQDDMPRGVSQARALAQTALVQRSQDFAAAARTYLVACRLLWDALETGEPGANLADLGWYIASYASVRAGDLSQNHRDYAGSRPYYLAFFTLIQENDQLWGRMRGLINPMLSYFWANAMRELGQNPTVNPSAIPPAQMAVLVATHPGQAVREKWREVTVSLAQVNPDLLRRVANQILMAGFESPAEQNVAEQIERILAGG